MSIVDLLAMHDDPHRLVLRLSRTAYGSHEWPAEYVHSVYRAAYYEFHLFLHDERVRIATPSGSE